MSFTPWKPLPDRMKLLILSTEFPPGPGGIGTHAYELASGLQSLGWQVAVIAPQDYVTKAERVMFNEQLPFAVNTLANGSVARRLRQIWKTLRQTRPDLLIATGSRSLWAAMLLCPLLGIPWLAIGHGTEFKKSGRLVRFLTRQAVRRADQMVAVSRYTARLVADERPNPIPVIPNGADAKRFRPDLPTAPLRHELGLDGRQILLTVGHVSERKAQDIVIRALPAVLTQCPDAVYLVAGLPTRQAALQKLATELHVAEHVIFAGMVPPEQLPTYFNLCDLFILVSREARQGDLEGYGIVVVEAALCGKTAIVSDHGGLPEAVHDGQTGLIVPPESPDETAQAIISLLTNEQKRASLAHEALKKAATSSWEHRVASYDAILKEMLV